MHKGAWFLGMSLQTLTQELVLDAAALPAARRCSQAAPCSDVRS